MAAVDTKSGPDSSGLTSELRNLASGLTRTERALFVRLLTHPTDSHANLAEAIGVSRRTVERAMSGEALRTALGDACARAVQTVEELARADYVAAYTRVRAIFQPGSVATNGDLLRAFEALHDLLTARELRAAYESTPPGRPIGCVVVRYHEPDDDPPQVADA